MFVEFPVAGNAKVILHVAGAFDVLRVRGAAFEFVEKRPERFRHDVGQHVQPAAMRHAEYNFLHPELAAALDDLFERRHHGLGAFDAKALRAGIFFVDELLQALRLDELGQDCLLAEFGEIDFLIGPFDTFLNPLLLRRSGDVHEFEADGSAIGPLQDFDDLAQACRFQTEHIIDINLVIEIGGSEAVGCGVEFVMGGWRRKVQGIEVRDQVTVDAIGANKHQSAHGLARCPERLFAADFYALLLRFGADLAANLFFFAPPVRCEGVEKVAIAGQPAILGLPRRAVGFRDDGVFTFLQVRKKCAPVGGNRSRILLKALV